MSADGTPQWVYLKKRLDTLERENRRLRGVVYGWGVFTLAVVAGVIWLGARSLSTDRILRVRGIAVVDEHGMERIWIGAPAPDPRILGKRYKRLQPAYGIIFFDAEGNERGGLVAFGRTVVLLMDDLIRGERLGLGVEPDGSAFLSVGLRPTERIRFDVGTQRANGNTYGEP